MRGVAAWMHELQPGCRGCSLDAWGGSAAPRGRGCAFGAPAPLTRRRRRRPGRAGGWCTSTSRVRPAHCTRGARVGIERELRVHVSRETLPWQARPCQHGARSHGARHGHSAWHGTAVVHGMVRRMVRHMVRCTVRRAEGGTLSRKISSRRAHAARGCRCGAALGGTRLASPDMISPSIGSEIISG